MIKGVGVDIVEVARIEQALSRRGDQFAEKILSSSELLDYDTAPSKKQFLAKRFAMKEAFSKALGTGMRGGLSFNQISIGHDALGKPLITLSQDIEHLISGVSIHVSVSDEKNTVVAFVVIETSHQ